MRSSIHAAGLFLFLLAVENSSAQMSSPTESERQAAYCVQVIGNDIESMKKQLGSQLLRKKAMELTAKVFAENAPESQRATVERAMAMMQQLAPDYSKRMEAEQKKLDAATFFLQPRLEFLDKVAMSVAAKSAVSDLQELWQCRSDVSVPITRVDEAKLIA